MSRTSPYVASIAPVTLRLARVVLSNGTVSAASPPYEIPIALNAVVAGSIIVLSWCTDWAGGRAATTSSTARGFNALVAARLVSSNAAGLA